MRAQRAWCVAGTRVVARTFVHLPIRRGYVDIPPGRARRPHVAGPHQLQCVMAGRSSFAAELARRAAAGEPFPRGR